MIKKWTKLLSREGADITSISGIDIVFYDMIWQFMGEKEELFFTKLENKIFTHYTCADIQEVGRSINKKDFNSIKQIEKKYYDGLDLIKSAGTEAKTFSKKLNSNLSKEILEDAFEVFQKDFMKICYDYSIVSWLAIEAWQVDFEKMLAEMIKRNGLEKLQGDISVAIYKPWKLTALPQLQQELKNGVDKKTLIEKYQFLRNWAVVWYRPIDEKWIEDVASGIAKEIKTKFTREKLYKLLKPSSQEKAYIELAPYLIFFKDWRDDMRRKYAYHWHFLFEKLSSYLGVSYEDIGYLSLDEIKKSIANNKLNIEAIKQRKENSCIITITGKILKITVIDKNVPEKYSLAIQQALTNEQAQTIKGLIAQQGKVKGKVKIVRTYHDVKNVEKGDILVAATTHPNYLPGMQKANAFVTDEGGIISHAAIVSRELKKPCIVGTKVATRILKDGDIVEVDANEGVVKVLKGA